MISKMRAITPVVMWIVIVSFVGTIAFVWGMDITGHNAKTVSVGKVAGREIPAQYFERLVSNEREKMRQQNNGEIPAYQNKMVPYQVWETEVSKILYHDLFAKMGLSGTGDEVFTYLKKNPPKEVLAIPQFQTDSVFDTAKFVQFLNNPQSFDNEGMQQLEAHLRDLVVPLIKLQSMLELTAFPSRSEIAREHQVAAEKAVFEYAKISWESRPLKDSAVPAPQIAAYYSAHRDSFYSEEQVNLYYVKIPKTPTPADTQLCLKELQDIRKKMESKEMDFAAAAKSESDDEGTAINGGDLGWFGKGSMVAQFEAVAFTLKKGQISEPVKTPFGFHLILVEDTRTKEGKPQVKALHILRKIVPSVETIDSLEALIDNLRNQMLTKGLREACTAKNGVILDSTGFFKKGQFLQAIGDLYGVNSFAFNNKLNDISDKFENTDGFYLFQIKDRIPKGIMPLGIVRDRIVRVLSDSLKMKEARGLLQNAAHKLAPGSSLSALKTADAVIATGTTDSVSRNQFVPDIGMNNNVTAAAFATPLKVVSPVVEASGSLYMVRPLWRSPQNVFDQNSAEVLGLAQQLYVRSKEHALTDWYLQYKSTINIVNNVSKYFSD